MIQNILLLKNIIKEKDQDGLKKFILDKCDFKYTFSDNNFWTDIAYFIEVKKFIFKHEAKQRVRLRDSLLFKISLNLFDYNQDVRHHFNWKCQKCKINCINDKDLLDVHVNHSLGLRGREKENIIEKKDLIVYCRVCHYNIDPKNHKNLDMSKDIYSRIEKLKINYKRE